MGWCIGGTEAMSDPVSARRKALAKLRGLEDLDDPESLVVPILIDAILMAESYRGARHQVTFLDEMKRSVYALIGEPNAAEKARERAEPVTGAGRPFRKVNESATHSVQTFINHVRQTWWSGTRDRGVDAARTR